MFADVTSYLTPHETSQLATASTLLRKRVNREMPVRRLAISVRRLARLLNVLGRLPAPAMNAILLLGVWLHPPTHYEFEQAPTHPLFTTASVVVSIVLLVYVATAILVHECGQNQDSKPLRVDVSPSNSARLPFWVPDCFRTDAWRSQARWVRLPRCVQHLCLHEDTILPWCAQIWLTICLVRADWWGWSSRVLFGYFAAVLMWPNVPTWLPVRGTRVTWASPIPPSLHAALLPLFFHDNAYWWLLMPIFALWVANEVSIYQSVLELAISPSRWRSPGGWMRHHARQLLVIVLLWSHARCRPPIPPHATLVVSFTNLNGTTQRTEVPVFPFSVSAPLPGAFDSVNGKTESAFRIVAAPRFQDGCVPYKVGFVGERYMVVVSPAFCDVDTHVRLALASGASLLAIVLDETKSPIRLGPTMDSLFGTSGSMRMPSGLVVVTLRPGDNATLQEYFAIGTVAGSLRAPTQEAAAAIGSRSIFAWRNDWQLVALMAFLLCEQLSSCFFQSTH
jgi:hypothetical protein